MKRKRIKKGEVGYLNYKKKNDIIKSIVISVVALIILFIGIYIYKTRLNYFTIVSILLFLPAARNIVYVIIRLKFKSIDYELAKEVEESFPFLNFIYDLVFTTESKFYQVDIIAISNKSIYGLSLKDKNPDDITKYIKTVFKNNNLIGYNIKIFSNKKDYFNILDGLQAIAEIEDNTSADYDKILRLLYSITI